MRIHVTSIFFGAALAIILLAFSFPLSAFAQGGVGATATTTPNIQTDQTMSTSSAWILGGSCIGGAINPLLGLVCVDGIVTNMTNAAGLTDSKTIAERIGEAVDDASIGSCGVTDMLNPLNWIPCAANALALVILTFTVFFLSLAGIFFNWMIVKTVFGFSTLIGSSPGLLIAWSILRDIGNMLLLFGFIFIGLATILGLQTYAAKKALPKLIIFAILMNFSLFIAGAVIDTSNGLSSVLYNQANEDPCFTEDAQGGGEIGGVDFRNPGTTVDAKQQCILNHGIAANIMEKSGIASIYRGEEGISTLSTSVILMLSIFSIITAFVLFAAAIMLLVRAVTLAFLMVLAPIGFAALAIPALEKHGKEWWNKLIHQSFFAPILLLLIFVSLKIVESFAAADSNMNLAAALSRSNSGTMGVIMVFGLVIGFMIASVIAAKKFGAMGADFAVNSAAKLSFGGLNLGLSGSGRLARMGLQRTPLGKTGVGRAFTNMALRPVEKGKLDMRRLPGMSSALSMAGAGDAAKAADTLKYADEKVQDIRKGMKENRKAYDDEMANIELARELRSGNPLSPESERFLASLSAEQIAANRDLQQSVENLADRLSPDQFEGLMKSDKIDGSNKAKLRDARFKAARAAIGNGYADRAVIRNLSNKDLEMLAKYDPAAFNDLMNGPGSFDPATGDSTLSGDQADALGKSSALTNTQRSNIRAQTRTGRIEAAVSSITSPATTPAQRGIARNNVRTWVGLMSSKTKAKLNVNSLTNADVMSTFTAGDLAEIQREGKLSAAEINAITRTVTSAGHANSAVIQNWIAANPNAQAYWR